MNYVEHFCDLRMDTDLCLGNNVLMAKLSTRSTRFTGNAKWTKQYFFDKYGIHEQCYNMRFVDMFLSLQTNSS